MSNQVVTIGYLKTFVNGVISVNTTKSDSYCPTYAELTGGTLVQNYSAGTNPTNHKPGIRIPSCTVGVGYTNNQLVIRQDLQLLWYVLQSVDVSASPTTISCCGGSSTLSTTAYFNLSTKKENGITTASTNTSTVITASYSDDKSYTTISGNKITFSKNSVNYPSSTSAAARSTTVTSTYEYSGVTKTDTVSITQNSNSVGSWTWISDTTTSISVSPASMSFESGGGSKSYSVTRYYTSYYEKYDSCNTLMDTDTDSNSASVTPTGYDCTGDFTCTSSKVSCDTNTGSSRTGTLTVTWGGFSDTCSLSQGASQAGTTNGEPYNYDYYVYVSVASSYVGCEGGTATFNAYYITTWDYDWETKNDAGEVTNSGTSSDSSSTNVTNSATWTTTLGTISNGKLTLGAYSEDNRRTATVKATYNGYSDTEIAYQESCAPDTPITPPATPCMTIYYTISNGAAATVYFKTTNGTQQGSHEVDAQGSQQLCNIAEGTELVVSCNNGDVTVGGDTSFTFYSGTTASISLTKPGGGGGSTCTAKTNYTGLTLSSYTFEACDTSPSLTVKANGIRTYSDCSTATTSTTLSSSNYTTSYDKTPSVNQNSSNQTYRVTITGKGTYAGLSDSVNIVQNAGPCNTGSTASTCMNIEYSIPVALSSSVIVSFKDSSSAIIASHTVPSTTGTTTKEICGLTNGKALTASCSDDTVTMSGGINFNFSAGTTEYITIQAPNSGPTGSTVTYSYSGKAENFGSCATSTTVKVYEKASTASTWTDITSNVTPTLKYKTNSTSYATAATPNSGSTSVVWSVQITFNRRNESQTVVANATQDAGPCPDLCTCSVTSISVSPSNHTFSSSTENKTFTVTINDNSSTCTKCNGGFKVYDSNGLVVESGTTSFTLSNQSGTFTIKANDNTGKTCTLTTTEYTTTTPVCNTPMGSFAGDYDFRVDFSEAVTSDITVYIDEKDGDCNVINSFEVTVSKGKKTGYGYDVLDQNHDDVVAAYFEITDVSPSSDNNYYYWGNGCEYDDSGNCTPKTKYNNIISYTFPYTYGGYLHLTVSVNGVNITSGIKYSTGTSASNVYLYSFNTYEGDTVDITFYGIGYLDGTSYEYQDPTEPDTYGGDWRGNGGMMTYTSSKNMNITCYMTANGDLGGGGGGVIPPSPTGRT